MSSLFSLNSSFPSKGKSFTVDLGNLEDWSYDTHHITIAFVMEWEALYAGLTRARRVDLLSNFPSSMSAWNMPYPAVEAYQRIPQINEVRHKCLKVF